jgi:hypothetical protein
VQLFLLQQQSLGSRMLHWHFLYMMTCLTFFFHRAFPFFPHLSSLAVVCLQFIVFGVGVQGSPWVGVINFFIEGKTTYLALCVP